MEEDWRIKYNIWPHSALGYLIPTEYAKTWTANHPTLSDPLDKQPGASEYSWRSPRRKITDSIDDYFGVTTYRS